MGLCECGCGATTTSGRRFRLGHWAKTDLGASVLAAAHSTGRPSPHGDGYTTIKTELRGKRKLHHRVVMEQLLGRPLLDSEIVHHEDENRSNNDPSNLKLFSSNSEHTAYHERKRALLESGNATWRKCPHCNQWDAPENLVIRKRKNGKSAVEHQICGNEYRRKWAAKKREGKPKKILGHDSQGRFVVIAEEQRRKP